MMQPRKWSLVLIPDHLGVIHVGGRVGADQGPQAFEKVFARLGGKLDLQSICEPRLRLGELNGPIEQNHLRASEAVAAAHQATGLSVVVGGGHDHGFSHLRGLKQAAPGRWGCINLDAHLDVRKPEPESNPKITSGSPFYLALEEGVLAPEDLVEFGIQSHCNGQALWDYVERKKVAVVNWADLRAPGRAVAAFAEQLAGLASRVDHIAVSWDLDALSQAHCPGVSAPQAEGFDPREVIEMLEIAGRHAKVRSLGIFELNPVHDVQDSTARVAATGAAHFLATALGR